tara:strand:+ start:10828 stop:11190 length:363 start_codon:yes stop_codon:yes gene_type:complete
MLNYKKIKTKAEEYTWVIIIVAVILISFLWFFIRQIFMRFEKEIVVKDKYIKNSGRSSSKIVVDENNNAYVFEDAILLGDMNSLDDYNKIEKGKKYKISGSGIRITYLSLFPVIYEVKEI